jgi:hypothetical protein
MRRYLVVAHRTLGGQHLLDEVRRRHEAGESEFHLLVPVHHPSGAWTDGSVERDAKKVLDGGLEQLRAAGIEATGEIGDANPVYAVDAVLRRDRFDEIIVSTLPVKASKWLKMDVPSRMAREFSLPIVHVVADAEHVF